MCFLHGSRISSALFHRGVLGRALVVAASGVLTLTACKRAPESTPARHSPPKAGSTTEAEAKPAAQIPLANGESASGVGEDAAGFLQGDLFPDNSVLKRVILPSFNLELQLVNTLTAEEMTIVTKKDIEAKNVKIDFFGPNRTHKGTIDLKKATFNASDKILRSKDPVSFVSENLNVDGTSLDFDTANNRGFLHGPVKAVSKSPPRTP